MIKLSEATQDYAAKHFTKEKLNKVRDMATIEVEDNETQEAHYKALFLDAMSTYYDLMEQAGIDGFKVETTLHTLGFKFVVKIDSMRVFKVAL